MDKDQLNFHSRNDSHDRKCVVEKEGYAKGPSADVKISIRKSSRLQKKKMSSCSKDVFKSSIYTSKIWEGNKHQIQNRNKISGVFSSDTVSVKSSKVVPSFKYQVLAKEGIQLVVDFNMKQSDWLKSMEKEICVCQNHLKPEFESFKKEVEYIGNKTNLKASLPDKTTASDTSLNFYEESKFSLNSMSREYEEIRPLFVENEVITVSGSDRCWSKVDQNMDLRYDNSKVQENCLNSGSVLTSTTAVNHEASGNHQYSAVENRERTNSAERMEVSGGEENVLVTLESKGGPKRRKCYHKSDNINGQSHERIMRSTKLYGSQIIDYGGILIRQSPRLYSK